tara:strand:- start:3950 stop:4684 length:735 start_codon:yes stop_codon:yes gene_type:complete
MYDKIFHFYDLLHDEKDYEKESEMIKEYVNLYSDFSKVKNILDFGCGTCSHLHRIIGNKKAVGVDVSLEMLNIAKQKFIPNLSFRHGKLETLNFEHNFDLCISMFNVINHIESLEELETIFKRISQVLNCDSLLIFDCINAIAAFADKPRDREIFKKMNSKDEIKITSTCYTEFMNSKYILKNKGTVAGQTFIYELNQTLWTPKILKELLHKNNFDVIAIYKHFTFEHATERDYKIIFIARKTL